MELKKVFHAILILAGAWALLTPFPCAADYKIIDITQPSLRKVPLAVPTFQPTEKSSGAEEVGREGADVLSEILDFTGYFKILDRGAFLADPMRMDISGVNTNFRNWSGVGAELLITGGVSLNDKLMELELRLFDTVTGKLLTGKRYKGWVTDQRRIMLRFASEVIYALTGDWGVFESKIAFISTASGKKEAYACDFDGRNPEQLTRNKTITLSPAWSANAQWLAYTSYKRGKPDIYIQHMKEKRGYVVDRDGLNITPAWVPGKFEFAATLSFSGDQEIYLLTGAGKIIKKITNNPGIDVSPAWSPDGTRMAFVSDRSGSPQIYIKDMKTGSAERLTYEGNYNTQPSWSPRGDRIAYSSMDKDGTNIFVIDLRSGLSMPLTRGRGRNESPSWAPDGSMIAFSSTREGPSRIYVMTSFGTEQRRLLSHPGEQTMPKWSPRIVDY